MNAPIPPVTIWRTIRKCFSISNKRFRFPPNIRRSNTSILAQKKKNQKKKASRKRALDRRHSEGSESEKHDDEFDEKVSVGWMS